MNFARPRDRRKYLEELNSAQHREPWLTFLCPLSELHACRRRVSDARLRSFDELRRIALPRRENKIEGDRKESPRET